MPRHLRKVSNGRAEAIARMDAFVGSTPRKRSSGVLRKKHIEEVRGRMKTKDWDGMTSGKLVALYWLCHEKVYGVVPVELDRTTAWETAMKVAGSMMKRHFDEDIERAITFMRWVWTREADREKWRRDNQKDGQRINWRNQFAQDYLITDWRTAAMRK